MRLVVRMILPLLLLAQVSCAADGPAIIAAVRDFAAKRGLAERIEGAGSFRILWFGGTAAPAGTAMIKYGAGALDLMESWTGSQRLFMPENPGDEDVLWMAILPDDKSAFALIDHLRAEGVLPPHEGGQDLAKIVPGGSLGPVYYKSAADLTKLRLHDSAAAYAAACLAIDRYFRAHQELTPAWIREGFATEVQWVQLKSVRCTTVSYELNDHGPVGNWRKDAARVLQGKVKGVKPMSAVDTLRGQLECIPFTTYQQYCSLFAFLRDASLARKDAKGAENRLARIVAATYDGAACETAVADAFGITEPTLTSAWYTWAGKQK